MKIKILLIIIAASVLSYLTGSAQVSRPLHTVEIEDTSINAVKNIKSVTDVFTETFNDTVIKKNAFVEVVRYNRKGNPVLDSLNFKYHVIQYRPDDETLKYEKFVNKNQTTYLEVFYNEKGIRASQIESHGRVRNLRYYDAAGNEVKWVFIKDSIRADSGTTKYSILNNGRLKISLNQYRKNVSDSISETFDDAGRLTRSFTFTPQTKSEYTTRYTYSADGKLTEDKSESNRKNTDNPPEDITYLYQTINTAGDIKIKSHSVSDKDSLFDVIIIKNKKGQVLQDIENGEKLRYYYDNDKIVKLETYRDDALTETDEYKYDANGVLQSIKTTEKNGESGGLYISTYTYNYEYY